MSWRASRAMLRHELRILLGDPSTLIFVVAMPVLMTALMKPLYQGLLRQEGFAGATGAEQAVPGMAVAFAAFSVGYSGFAFFREHGWGTWERLRASAASPVDIMVGKLVPPFVITLVQIGLLFVVGVPLFGFRVAGSVAALTVVIVAIAVALTAFGMALTALSKTSQQLNAFGGLGSMLFGIMGGAFVPVAVMPGWARAVAPVMPTYWAMRGFRSVTLDGGGMSAVALPVVVLLGMAALFAAVAAWKFRFEETRIYFG